MKKVGRNLSMIIVAALLTLGIGYAVWPSALQVEMGTVSRGGLQVSVEEDGKTRVKDRYVVAAPLSGQLARIEWDAGDPVEANKTVLAEIDPTDPALLDARVLAEAEARLKSAEAAEMQAEARLKVASETLDLAKHRFARAKELFPTRAVPQAELEETEHQERIAAEALRAASFAMQVAKYEKEVAQAALVRTNPRDGKPAVSQRMEIRSPIDGRILRVIQESATVVVPGQQLLELGNPDALEIEIDVLSVDAAKIAPGAKVYLEEWGGEEPLIAHVRRVEPSGFTKVSALGVDEQRVNVIADFDRALPKDLNLGDAYRVQARIVVWERDDTLQVPTGALFRIGKEWNVFVVQAGRASVRPVKIGKNSGLQAEVLEGLVEGERVILYPSDRVRAGVRVR